MILEESKRERNENPLGNDLALGLARSQERTRPVRPGDGTGLDKGSRDYDEDHGSEGSELHLCYRWWKYVV